MTDQHTSVALAISEAERQEVFRFRYAVYVEEMGKSPPDANHDRRELMDRFDASASLYVLRDGEGALVGTLRFNRLEALASALEALRPIAPDFLLEQAPLAALSYTSRLMLRADWRGGNRQIGRQLGRLLEESGYDPVDVHMETVTSRQLGMRAFLDITLGFKRLLLEGEELEAARATLEAADALVDDPRAWAFVGVFLARGVRP